MEGGIPQEPTPAQTMLETIFWIICQYASSKSLSTPDPKSFPMPENFKTKPNQPNEKENKNNPNKQELVWESYEVSL